MENASHNLDSNNWDAVLAIFDEVRDVDDLERDRIVGIRCAGNIELEAEVRSLLKHHRSAGAGFLAPEEVLPARRVTPGLASMIGSRISTFTICSEIGSGATGMIYRASQANPKRDVAIKIMWPDAWSAAIEKRFDVESQILGYLRHPHVAQIFEAGTSWLQADSPFGSRVKVHYIAMELIPDARTITGFVHEFELSIAERLNLFRQVCGGVQHAHQKGVIHRDLKPANILVDPEGTAKVIDFGIAKTTDSDLTITTMPTELGQILGTLGYMSPEQCAADPSQIDTTTDIYSLGVILYELLAERLPYDLAHLSIHSIVRVICEQEPESPSRFVRSVRGDLDTIVLKALEKDPRNRYASVAALDEDIQRYLCGQPISTRAPSAYAKVMRWATRSPKSFAAIASTFIAFIIVGTAVFSIHAIKSTPVRLELAQNGSIWDYRLGRLQVKGEAATLISAAGTPLHRWTVDHQCGINFARLVNRASQWGGGKVVILGYGIESGFPYRGELCLYDLAKSYETPALHFSLIPKSIRDMDRNAWPRPKSDLTRTYSSDHFSVHNAWMFDIFPDEEHPGEEIVINHMHNPGSQGTLSIYNLNGEILFQVWQDGGIEEAYWLEEPQLLVCVAIKGDKDDYEEGLSLKGNHPHILFAIRPELDLISNAWIHPYPPNSHPRFEGDAWNGDWYRPVWYKLPCPIGWADEGEAELRLDSPIDPLRSQSVFVLKVFFDEQLSNKSPYLTEFEINSQGEIISRMIGGDLARKALRENPNLPQPEDLRLLEWNAEVAPCRN
ncbi:MAG TPA: serine/threonine-protein kinase [Phycisphaerae bacterium]|nr:serine/threonine-protein kinase [Phycisphaerae bacterium]